MGPNQVVILNPAWAHRTLLLRGYNTLSKKGRDRLAWVFATDDPTDELVGVGWVAEDVAEVSVLNR